MMDNTSNLHEEHILYDYCAFVCQDTRGYILYQDIIQYHKSSTKNIDNYPTEENAEGLFWFYQNKVLTRLKEQNFSSKVIFYKYDIKNTYLHLDNNTDNFSHYIVPYLKANNISPSIVKSYFPILINNQYEYPNCFNAAKLLIENSFQPDICEGILQNLISDPLRPIPNNDEILSALKTTSYYHDNKLYVTNINDIKWFSSAHFYLENLKCELGKCQVIKDLISFQATNNVDDRCQQIFAYRNLPEITKKQIEICTRSPVISSPSKLYTKLQDTIYYQNELKYEFIQASGPEWIHLIYIASKMETADRWHRKDDLKFWSLKEEILKEKIYIQLGLFEKYGFNTEDHYLKRKIEYLHKDIEFALRKGFIGLEDAVTRLIKLQNQFISNKQPEKTKFPFPESFQIEMNNITLSDFNTYSNQIIPAVVEMSANMLSDYNGEWFDFTDFFLKMNNLTKYECPIAKPIFNVTLKFNFQPTHEKETYKVFIKDFLTRLGYIDTPYIAFKDAQTIDIYTSNIIFAESKFHPLCTVDNFRNGLQILSELEIKYGFLKEMELSRIKTNINSYLDKEKSDDPNEKGQKPGLKK